MHYVSGLMLTDEGFIEGHIGFEDGRVVEVGRGEARSSLARGVIVPTMVNAHTHIADFLVPVDFSLPLEQIVAPPDGLKHRMLKEIPGDRLIKSMRHLARYMLRRGTSHFIDFREGGVIGAQLLSKIRDGTAKPVIFGRPSGLEFLREEVDEILKVADGIGVSAISDWDYSVLHDLASYVRKKKKRFALHASERIREDIDKVLDLRPSFIVHMTVATDSDLELCAQENVPIVVCPRSNLLFGRIPPLDRMIHKGVRIALGTDNAMFSLPDMFTELEFAGRILRYQGIKEVDDVLTMVFKTGREILGLKGLSGLAPGDLCDFMVIESKGGDPVTDLVFRSSSSDPIMVCVGERVLGTKRIKIKESKSQ
ncbi:MAG: amidohydrolase family protein [Methanomassiliicoccales archaeon]|nr:amidohydrolase family protein [Methanomassiliicoccales archaeon]